MRVIVLRLISQYLDIKWFIISLWSVCLLEIGITSVNKKRWLAGNNSQYVKIIQECSAAKSANVPSTPELNYKQQYKTTEWSLESQKIKK